MTPTAPAPNTQTPRALRARHRRVKRGIVAGYLHGLSPRHRPVVAAPVPARLGA
jgi:hypothetical protein